MNREKFTYLIFFISMLFTVGFARHFPVCSWILYGKSTPLGVFFFTPVEILEKSEYNTKEKTVRRRRNEEYRYNGNPDRMDKE